MTQTPAKKPAFLGVDHIAVAVNNLDDAVRIYSEMLGFSISDREHLENRGIDTCFIDTGNVRLELLAPAPTPPHATSSELDRFLATHGEGLHHIAVRVRDIEEHVTRLREAGAQIVGDGVQTGAQGRRVAFVHPRSTHGVLLELVEDPGTPGHAKGA